MKKRLNLILASIFLLVSILSTQSQGSISHAAAADPIRFAAIGDFGDAGVDEAAVASLVDGWNPDFIITLGDNNYEGGKASTIDQNIGQYYHSYIYPYTGSYGAGATTNRFFPSLGNHDWLAANAQPYLDYFTLPGNERYYDYVEGPVHFFVIDSDEHELDGRTSGSKQAVWLKSKLADSNSPWNVVYFHHPPYSSSNAHGSNPALQWNFQAWGADIVLSGHDHGYERIVRYGFPYIINGLGGAPIYKFGTPVAGSQVRYNAKHGAMLIEADDIKMTLSFYNVSGSLIDRYAMQSIFGDVPGNYWATDWILKMYFNQVTGGCSTTPRNYCPLGAVTRAEMAVFLLRAKYGNTYTPPPATGLFMDVPTDFWAAAWIEQLAREGITGGCGSGNFCPNVIITRDQMAVLLLRAKHGDSYNPPNASGSVFDDVPADYWAANWIEQLAAEGITSGCDPNSYCPTRSVTRDQMAVFVVTTFNLP